MDIKFGFISHTFEFKNLQGMAPTLYRKDIKVVEKTLESSPPKEICRVKNLTSATGVNVEGIVVTTWLFPSQYLGLPSNNVFKRISDAVRIAEREGAKIVGLGGYNSIVPIGSGLRIARNSRIGVTNGNSYTIVLAIDATKNAVEKAGLRMEDLSVAVIGATGSIGSVVADLMALENPASLTLVARNEARLKGRAEAILKNTGYQAAYLTDVAAAVRNADILITATSNPDSVIDANDILPGAIVCDVAVPHDVSERVVHQRDDVLVFEGGLARAPHGKYTMKPDYTDDLDLIPGELYACFCETAILAMEGHFDHFSLDGISLDVVKKIKALADKHGFTLAHLRNKKYHPIPDHKFSEIGEVVKARKNKS